MCIMKRWLVSPRGVGKPRKSLEHDSFGTTLMSCVGALLKPVQQSVLYACLWSHHNQPSGAVHFPACCHTACREGDGAA